MNEPTPPPSPEDRASTPRHWTDHARRWGVPVAAGVALVAGAGVTLKQRMDRDAQRGAAVQEAGAKGDPFNDLHIKGPKVHALYRDLTTPAFFGDKTLGELDERIDAQLRERFPEETMRKQYALFLKSLTPEQRARPVYEQGFEKRYRSGMGSIKYFVEQSIRDLPEYIENRGYAKQIAEIKQDPLKAFDALKNDWLESEVDWRMQNARQLRELKFEGPQPVLRPLEQEEKNARAEITDELAEIGAAMKKGAWGFIKESHLTKNIGHNPDPLRSQLRAFAIVVHEKYHQQWLADPGKTQDDTQAFHDEWQKRIGGRAKNAGGAQIPF